VKALDSQTLHRFVQLAANRLTGDWVILGGAAVPLMGGPFRATLDIDIAGPKEASNSQSMILLDIATELGLPIEAVNQAAAFYLRQIEGWQDHLVLLVRGPSASIFRPDATLYLLLKISRLSEADLQDCTEAINLARRHHEPLDLRRIEEAISASGRIPMCSPARAERLRSLHQALLRLVP
jgi:hypothetical protein